MRSSRRGRRSARHSTRSVLGRWDLGALAPVVLGLWYRPAGFAGADLPLHRPTRIGALDPRQKPAVVADTQLPAGGTGGLGRHLRFLGERSESDLLHALGIESRGPLVAQGGEDRVQNAADLCIGDHAPLLAAPSSAWRLAPGDPPVRMRSRCGPTV